MKPVAIFRHSPTEGPGYFATYLDRRKMPWRLIKVDAGETVPAHPHEFGGLAFMGGPMSVNDDLPWIAPVLALIRAADHAGVPVIGHCLGGQLVARALGGTVSRNPVKEIGWGAVDVIAGTESTRWLGELERFESFHWHGETFTLPPGAAHLASSPYCANQMYARGKHFGMQCHIEITPELIAAWCEDWGREIESLAQRTPSVQTPDDMLDHVIARTRALNKIADRVYDEWVRGLAR